MFKLKRESGITGLETAIILIAFVVIAAVFSYTIISAGFFSTQKSSEAVYNGIKEAQGALELKGAVIGKSENPGSQGCLSQIVFSVAHVMGGEPVDFTPPLTSGTNGQAPAGSANKVVISYHDPYNKIDDLFWTVKQLGSNNGNNLLDPGEDFEITIGSPVVANGGGNLVDALPGHPLGPNTQFTIEVKTASGSTLSFQRTTPVWISPVVNLDTDHGVNLPGAGQ